MSANVINELRIYNSADKGRKEGVTVQKWAHGESFRPHVTEANGSTMKTRKILAAVLLIALAGLSYAFFFDRSSVCVEYRGEGQPCVRANLTLFESMMR